MTTRCGCGSSRTPAGSRQPSCGTTLGHDAQRIAVLGGAMECAVRDGAAVVTVRVADRIEPAEPVMTAPPLEQSSLYRQVLDLVRQGQEAATEQDRPRWDAVAKRMPEPPRLALLGASEHPPGRHRRAGARPRRRGAGRGVPRRRRGRRRAVPRPADLRVPCRAAVGAPARRAERVREHRPAGRQARRLAAGDRRPPRARRRDRAGAGAAREPSAALGCRPGTAPRHTRSPSWTCSTTSSAATRACCGAGTSTPPGCSAPTAPAAEPGSG